MTNASRRITWVALIAPLFAVAQPARHEALAQTASELAEQITTIQGREGPAAAALIEPLTALALLHFEAGDFSLASATIERTTGLIRANFGLTSLEQTALLRLLRDVEAARGNTAGAWETEQDLLELMRANPTELSTVAILREIADRRMRLIDRYLAGEYVPEVQLGCYYKAQGHHMGSCFAGSKSDAAASLLLDASEIYGDAANVIIWHDIYPSGELAELLTGLARGYYEYGPPRTAESAWELGRANLQRLYDYELAHDGPLLSKARALIAIADWDLAYVRQAEALDEYEAIIALLREGGASSGAIAELFAPAEPAIVPAFLNAAGNSDSRQANAAYVDLRFDVTRYGRSRNIDVLKTSANAPEQPVEDLVRRIRLSRFRPRIGADGTLDDTTVTVRYYLENDIQ